MTLVLTAESPKRLGKVGIIESRKATSSGGECCNGIDSRRVQREG